MSLWLFEWWEGDRSITESRIDQGVAVKQGNITVDKMKHGKSAVIYKRNYAKMVKNFG